MNAENSANSLDDLSTEFLKKINNTLDTIHQTILKSFDDIRADFLNSLNNLKKDFSGLRAKLSKTSQDVSPLQVFYRIKDPNNILGNLLRQEINRKVLKIRNVFNNSANEAFKRIDSLLDNRKANETLKESVDRSDDPRKRSRKTTYDGLNSLSRSNPLIECINSRSDSSSNVEKITSEKPKNRISSLKADNQRLSYNSR